ncbi:hypothetical protein [Nonomuraea endophytica]|uniref:hypothetical protein n=1 Tax=Nonomuraea endophytica TaxID=714136 RepID=UPI0037C89999
MADTPPLFHAPGSTSVIRSGQIIGWRKNGAPIRLQAGGAVDGMSEEELRALPVGVPLVTAGKALLMGRTKAHELARAGQFPVKTLQVGTRYIVPKIELLRYLGLGPDAPAGITEAAS